MSAETPAVNLSANVLRERATVIKTWIALEVFKSLFFNARHAAGGLAKEVRNDIFLDLVCGSNNCPWGDRDDCCAAP